MRQREAFVRDEGDRYFRRNHVASAALESRAESDPLLAAVLRLAPAPRRVLEVGAGDGWRLAALAARAPGTRCVGLEPSRAAVDEAARRFPAIRVLRGTAERLPFAAASFDCVLFGFCLYLCDPEDLFRIACEADRVLRDGGHLALHDFHAARPHREPYAHRAGLHSHKMEYPRMFAWHPAYTLVAQALALHPAPAGAPRDAERDTVAVTLLVKSAATAFPLRGAAEVRA